MRTFNEKGVWDYSGAVISWVCAIHCLAMPLLLTVFPLMGLSFLADETTEWLIIGMSVLVALVSLVSAAFMQHRKLRSILLFGLGISLILLSHLVFEAEFGWNALFVISGATLITAAHLINRRLCLDCQNLPQNAIHSSITAIH